MNKALIILLFLIMKQHIITSIFGFQNCIIHANQGLPMFGFVIGNTT